MAIEIGGKITVGPGITMSQERTPYVAVAVANSPYIAAYPWNNTTGFGTVYANPSSLPPSAGNDIAVHPSGRSVAVSSTSSPYVTAYPWIFGQGFGTKYSDPSSAVPNTARAVTFSPDGAAIAVATDTTPFITVYAWNTLTGFGTKYANPSSLPSNLGYSVAFNPGSTAIAVGHDFSPYISVYAWSSVTGFGSKYTSPATGPSGFQSAVVAVTWNKAGTVIAGYDFGGTPGVWQWSDSTGFGTQYIGLHSDSGYKGVGLTFTSDDSYIIVAVAGGPSGSLLAQSFNYTTGIGGTVYYAPNSLAIGTGVALSGDGTVVFGSDTYNPAGLRAWPWSNSTRWGTKYTDPTTGTSNTCNAVAAPP